MQQSSLIINNQQFARQQELLEGEIDALQLERLRAFIYVPSTPSETHALSKVSYQLRGSKDLQAQYFLHLSLEAQLSLTCQRCFGAMPFYTQLVFNYLITPSDEAEILKNEEDIDDALDLISADTEMDVALLIEDELMLALPIAPLHETHCAGLVVPALIVEAGEKSSPFAALKALIKPKS